MKIDVKKEEKVLLVIPEGRLDSVTSGELETVLNREITETTEVLRIDLAKVEFISSKGLRILVSAYRRMKDHQMILMHPNTSVLEVMRISGLLKYFTVEE